MTREGTEKREIPDVKPNFSIEKARKAQLQLSKKVVLEDMLPDKVRFVAGVDAAYLEGLSIGAVTVVDYPSLKVLESQTAVCKTRFPYVPTLLSFRETPPLIRSIRKLDLMPEVFLVDAHGFAHPYRCGLACHLGVILEKPTIGVAKSKLLGDVEDKDKGRGVSLLKHKGEVIGAVVITKRGSRPIYVSVGHRVSLETAVKIVKRCTPHTRIPKPILKSHQTATKKKRKINKNSTVNG